ncbi:hypothetical protein NVP1084O_125 [Vibrio phage 1.084.O._10N.261.49.F5]|nr:hypothetical protein NVP1084O_125 [Vibrio phage 1.084.O._10N.261.49.F5]
MEKLTHQEFIKKFGEGVKKLDLNRSLTQPEPLKLFDVFGTRYLAATHEDFKYNLENFVGKAIDWEYNEPYWTKVGVSLESIKDSVIDITSVVEDLEAEEEEVTNEDSKQPDWDWIGTLKNKKYDKVELDNYAMKEFNIKLNQRNTLENMIADFKGQIK